MEDDSNNTSKSSKETKNEVSLPGSNVNSIEQPTILQVLSPLNAAEEKVNKTKDSPTNRVILLQQPSSEEPQLHNDDNHDDNNASDKINLVNNSSSHKSYLEITTPTPTPTPTKDCKIDPRTGEVIFRETPSPRQDNILDIESHLIETYNELLYPNEESVGINELPPIADELQVGCSKIETDDNVRTVIEVQPAEVIRKKQIEQLIETDDPLQAAQIIVPTTELSNGETNVNKEEIEKVAKQLIEDLEEDIIQTWNEIKLQESLSNQTNEKSLIEQEDHLEENLAEKTDKPIETLVSILKVTETPEKSTNVVFETEKETTTTSKHNLELSENSLETPKQLSEIITKKTEEPNFVPTNDNTALITENCVENVSKLSEVVDQQISEVTSILDSQTNKEDSAKNQSAVKLQLPIDKHSNLKVVSVPSPKTALEVEERKLFIESLPHLQQQESQEAATNEAEKLALDCKREYYQSLKKYLIESSTDKPPLPLQTYRWEDLRRAKERGGYPWTHLYKRPLGPNDQPEIVLMLRKSQEIRFTSESPKSHKKVRIDDQVLIQETERYIQELSEEEEDEEHHSEHLPSHHQTEDLENHSLHSESFSCVSDSVLTTGKPPKSKSNRFSKVKRLFRRRRYGARQSDDAQSLPDSFTNTSLKHSLEEVPQGSQPKLEDDNFEKQKEVEPIYVHSKSPRCFPIMKKLKSMADRQKKHFNIKRIHLGKDDKIVLNEEPKILKLKNSPKSQRSDIPHFIEKQDSDDVLEIMELDESPSRKRRDDDRYEGEEEHDTMKPQSSLVKPEEIIEIPNHKNHDKEEEEVTYKKAEQVDAMALQPKKTPRLRREHVYEEIDQLDEAVAAAEELKFILDATSVEAIKQSLSSQDTSALKEVATTNHNIPLDRMGSSEEEPLASIDTATTERKSNSLLAPISSIDSASSDEDRSKLHLQPVTEEETDHEAIEEEQEDESSAQQIHLVVNQEPELKSERKPSLKKEASPAPSDKKVTFSHVEDEAEPHREDIELTAEQLEAAKEANKWKNNIKKYTFIILMKLLLTLRLRKRKSSLSTTTTTTGSLSRLSYLLSICLTPCCCSYR